MKTLTEIGTQCKTDKATWHKFTDLYENYYGSFRKDPIRLLEIGVYKGASLKMWHEYFSNGIIFGMDNCGITDSTVTPESVKALEKDRMKIFLGDQSNRKDLKKFIEEHGGDFDTIIDDGLHYQEHQQVSFGFLFPYIKSGGVYVIEDLCPSDRTKEGWGLKDFVNFSDNTTKILKDFPEKKEIISPFMTDEEMAYLNQNIKEVEVHQIENNTNIIAFIRKL